MAASAAGDEGGSVGYCAAGVADEVAALVVVLRGGNEVGSLGEEVC